MNPLSFHALRRIRRTVWLTGAAVAAATLLAACASSSGGGSAAPAAGGAASSSAASGALTIETHSGPLGTFLTDGQGRTLYMFASDTPTKSTCSGQCAVFWPPVTSTAGPLASGGATMSDIGKVKRADGSAQVTYAGHPLYYFKLDTAAGDTKGQARTDFGAAWWALTGKGVPITAAAAAAGGSSSSSSSSSSSDAGGGWS
jgi:predicted lipoprotein with Yx(FWY)xxD motif